MKIDHGINENNETNGKISGSFRFMSTPSKKVTIIGVLMDLGADRRGVDMGPSAGVGTPVQGGPTYRESHLAMEKIADSGKLLSFELAEVNPVLDTANRTAELGVQLISSAFGKKIM